VNERPLVEEPLPGPARFVPADDDEFDHVVTVSE
jgi:hypothetical protein